MAANTGMYKHQLAYNDRMHARGLCRVSVWVPEHLKDALVEHARDMRKESTDPALKAARPGGRAARTGAESTANRRTRRTRRTGR